MIETFPNRIDQLFGRMADIRRLLDRASRPGLTALVARPLMGKSWTLTEVARQLQEQGELVGYHESKGAESSHLLYAVSNLYARWLSDSTMREQAISLWARHKEALVPQVGRMVGMLFEKIGGSVLPEKVVGLVRQAFDGLAEAQKDLLSGGLQIAPLPYDQALSLTRLVADVSGRRIVLMLDAWEKSASARSEYSTLEALLKHLDSWPRTHVFLAVRYPELAATKDNEAYQRAHDLCTLSPAAHLYPLGEMSLNPAERQRLVRSVKERVTAAREESDDRIMALIDAYPGVLYFWTNEANRTEMATGDDLRRVAGNAQIGRYAELDRLLNALPEARCAIAARLAFLPRMEEARWDALRDLVLGGHGMAEIEGLIDAAVLNDEHVPSYGHDTRQAAARKWFVGNRKSMIRRLSEKLIEAMAARITGVNRESRVYFEELIGCQASAQDVGIDSDLRLLIDAARCPFGDIDGVMRHDFDAWHSGALRRNPLLAPIIAQALFKRGLLKSHRGDHEGAIADLTATIALPGAPVEQVAQAVYSRAIAKGQRGDAEGAIADYAAVIKLPGAPVEQVAAALFNGGITKGERSDYERAIADFTALLALPGASLELAAPALYNRAVAKRERGDAEGAIADYTAVIKLPGAPVEHVAQALYDRGGEKRELGDIKGAIADYTAVLALPGAPVQQVAVAFYNRGCAKHELGDNNGAIADLTAVIKLPSASPAMVERARHSLEMLKRHKPTMSM